MLEMIHALIGGLEVSVYETLNAKHNVCSFEARSLSNFYVRRLTA
jgi:hypothetical protein